MITYCNYGVSIGESSTAYLENCISAYNDGGIQVHTGAIVHANYNTLYGNTWGIECYHSEDGSAQTGGTAFVQNTIISGSSEEDILTQSSSEISISFSASDKSILPGNNNLFGNPLFTDASHGDFSLLPGSPCIQTGSGDDEGNPTNMGAWGESGKPLGVRDLPTIHQGVVCFPNPTADRILVTFSLPADARNLWLYDHLGRLLFSIQAAGNTCMLDLNPYPAGEYILRVSDKYGTGSFLILKR